MNAKLPVTWRDGSTLARAIVSAREKAGLSATDLARRAGVGRKFLHELERGKETLRADKVLAVLSVLGLELVVLPGGSAIGAKAWLKRNRGAIDAYNEHVARDGVFSDSLRSF